MIPMTIEANKKRMHHKQKHQEGITLVEVLVTVLILAIGGLGIASMQLAGLQYTNGAYARTQSVILANDMIDRIKSNRESALDDDYAIPTFGATVNFTTDCSEAECDKGELADYDRALWLAEVARVLPSGEGTVELVEQAGAFGITENQFIITLRWRQIANSSDQDATNDSEMVDVAYRVVI